MPEDFSKSFYPFLEESQETDETDVLAQVQHSTLEKCREVVNLRRQVLETYLDQMVDAAQVMAQALQSGHKLLAFGNGGSATDAQDMATDFMSPPISGRRSLPAISLTNDIAVVTAVGNDVGFDNIFVRQLVAFGQPGDLAFGISTSGNSPNVIAAFETAKKMGLLTIGLTGYEGGKMAEIGLDYCFVVPSTYIPRIQEVHATIYHTLWELVHHCLTSQEA